MVSAVQRCREIVDSDTQITVDMMITDHNTISYEDVSKFTTVHNWWRKRQIKNYENGLASLLKFMVDFPNVNYRHFAIPSKEIGSGFKRLEFANSVTWPMQQQGREDAKSDLQKPQGHAF